MPTGDPKCPYCGMMMCYGGCIQSQNMLGLYESQYQWRTVTRTTVELTPEEKAKLKAEAEAEFKAQRLSEMLAATESDPMEIPGWKLEVSRNRWCLGCIVFACLSAGLAVAHFGIPDVFKPSPKLDMLPKAFMDDVQSHLEAGGTVVTHIGGGLGGTTVEVQRGR